MAFGETNMSQLKPDCMVRVQDYHLMFLPLLLRTLIDFKPSETWLQPRSIDSSTDLTGVRSNVIAPGSNAGTESNDQLKAKRPRRQRAGHRKCGRLPLQPCRAVHYRLDDRRQ
ncbi:hypothetical protein LXA43DRAFT_1091799 [Ganoderma leucocontextum]|nr:hypothetical protein LXA43DRAFT_1091799 [Ganoderma leucocontextum]